jgi:HK97 family phage major capsid protein
MQKKAMSAGNDTAGGYIVPSEYIPELIELLYSNTVLMKLGATVLSGLTSSPIEIPKQTGGATAYWIEENEAITPSELTVGQIRMTPRAVAAMVKLSNRLIRMSNPSAEAMVRRDIALTLAQAIDIAGFRGSGVASQPLGIVNTDDINTVEIGPNGGPATFDTLIDMAYELEVDNALRGNLSYVFSPGVKRTLIQSKVAQYSGDTGGQYVVQPITDSALNGYVGYPYRTTTVLPTNLVKGTSTDCTEIIFANWQEMIIAQWAGLQIMASTETSDAFERNQTWIRIIQEVDFAVRHPQSFCVCNDARV